MKEDPEKTILLDAYFLKIKQVFFIKMQANSSQKKNQKNFLKKNQNPNKILLGNHLKHRQHEKIQVELDFKYLENLEDDNIENYGHEI